MLLIEAKTRKRNVFENSNAHLDFAQFAAPVARLVRVDALDVEREDLALGRVVVEYVIRPSIVHRATKVPVSSKYSIEEYNKKMKVILSDGMPKKCN